MAARRAAGPLCARNWLGHGVLILARVRMRASPMCNCLICFQHISQFHEGSRGHVTKNVTSIWLINCKFHFNWMLEVRGLKWHHKSVPDHQLHLLVSYILNLTKIDKVIKLLFNISNNISFTLKWSLWLMIHKSEKLFEHFLGLYNVLTFNKKTFIFVYSVTQVDKGMLVEHLKIIGLCLHLIYILW